MQVKIGSATFNVSFGNSYDDDPFGDGTPGLGGSFDVNRKRYAELYDVCAFERYSIDEDTTTYDPEEHDEDEDVTIPIGDDFITFANAASIEGGEWDIHYDGNPYWFFHDLSHARYDCSGGVVNIDQYGDDEDRALYEGAVEAREHGIGLGVIFRELAQVLKPFSERFNRETDAIERFAEHLEHEEVAS